MGWGFVRVKVKKMVMISIDDRFESRLVICDNESSCFLIFSGGGIEAVIYTPRDMMAPLRNQAQ